MKKKIEHPKVFISYAWGADDYQERVKLFAQSLMGDGVDVIFDKWSLKEGNDTYTFMEKTVNDSSITNVLLLIDPLYAEKANNKVGGVGTETQIISPEVYEQVNQDKFIPIIFKKDGKGNIKKPTFLKNRYHFDLSNRDSYKGEYKRLVQRLYGIDSTPKPELGNEPKWLENDDTLSFDDTIEFDVLEKSSDSSIQIEFGRILDSVKDELIILYKDRSNEEVDQIDVYNKIIPIRNKYLELLQYVEYLEKPEIILAGFLENIMLELDLDINNRNQKLYKIAMHEWFIYTISTFVKKNLFENTNYLFERTYFTSKYDNDNENHRFSVFFSIDRGHFDKRICDRDNKDYHCGTAQFWIDNVYIKYYSKDDFTFADILCFNASVYLEDYNDEFYWFPLTYIYAEHNNKIRQFSTKLKSIERANELIRLFSFYDLEDFKKQFVKVDEIRKNRAFEHYRYPRTFNSAPLINDYIKYDSIGIYN